MYAIDYDDYDYEPEPYDTEVVWSEYEKGDDSYEVEVEVVTWCIRQGNYSPVASDPDEYFGEYKTEYNVLTAYVYSDSLEDWVEVSEDDLPNWVKDEITHEFEE